MFPLDYPNSAVTEHEDLSSVCNLNSDFHFAIYIRRDIFDLDEISKIVNISHEFHHIFQYIKDKRSYLFGCIVRYFLNDIIPEVRSPVEYDAERKSKIVAYKTYGRKKVDEWIDSNANKTRHIFFEVFRDINVDIYYDLTAEVLRLWKEHEIEDEIARLRILEKHDDDEKRIIEMYEYAIRKCSN